ncbi:hypothetical protein BRADI_5g10102v3 [Brachypodium distachyon]|uniref:Uncharacterized protein n=1 Tax=Brachypodium distachyon TaxID=15368 RepID=A0A2K2CGC4_BRADI|nr:hypothetical protein BRADI_5g10102v3 [Brachypodium distachyon]
MKQVNEIFSVMGMHETMRQLCSQVIGEGIKLPLLTQHTNLLNVQAKILLSYYMSTYIVHRQNKTVDISVTATNWYHEALHILQEGWQVATRSRRRKVASMSARSSTSSSPVGTRSQNWKTRNSQVNACWHMSIEVFPCYHQSYSWMILGITGSTQSFFSARFALPCMV